MPAHLAAAHQADRPVDTGKRSFSAALLDVYPDEPIPGDSPLLRFGKARLILTPHCARVSRDIPAYTAEILAQGLFDLTRHRMPTHVANEAAVSACFRRLAKIVGQTKA